MRTAVDLPQTDRNWLDKKANEQGISLAEALRRILKAARQAEQKAEQLNRSTRKVGGAYQLK